LTVVDGSTSNDGSYADLVITNMSEHNNARLLLGTPHQTTSSSGFKAAIIADGAGTYSRLIYTFVWKIQLTMKRMQI